jgi:hypothetical protein
VSYLQVVNIFQIAVLGGPQNQSLTRSNAHLQECGNDIVGAPDGHPRLIGDSYGFVVLLKMPSAWPVERKNGQVILSRAPWTLTRTEM